MTQTNNEREALIEDAKKAGFIHDECMGLMLPICLGLRMESLLSNFSKIVQDRAQSPISQNEQQGAVAYTDGEGDFITKEMYDEYLKLGFYTECVVPLYNSPPKQIPDEWKPSEKEILKYASDEELFLFADESDLLEIANGILELVQIKINTAPTTSLTSETNTEVAE